MSIQLQGVGMGWIIGSKANATNATQRSYTATLVVDELNNMNGRFQLIKFVELTPPPIRFAIPLPVTFMLLPPNMAGVFLLTGSMG